MAGDRSSESAAHGEVDPRLEKFDHVVVLMMENRSLDNLLGFLYPDGVTGNPMAGKTFEGVPEDWSNPVPAHAKDQPPDGSGRVFVSKTTDYKQPFPDPGEEYYHVNVQLFNQPNTNGKPTNSPPYNLPPERPLPTPSMDGFVTDYIEKLGEAVSKPKDNPQSFKNYSQIMHCFDPDALPVLATLARDFAVFDHWHCSVPSQTWCNRAFWHAGTSFGRVNNSPFGEWFKHNGAPTIFNQISDSNSHLSWKVYHDTPVVSLTNLIHFHALDRHEFHFHSLDKFFHDCKHGELPSYSFLEPDFIFDHNDYHPSSAGWDLIDGKEDVGAVLLGERLVAKVYNAVKDSMGKPGSNGKEGNTSQNTLLIITFDEHGGCADHVHPLTDIKPPDLGDLEHQEGFDFTRSGMRVPMIMISAHIAPNTVINEPMMHTSFLNTVQAKWGAETSPDKFPPISDRQQSDGMFTDVFTAPEPRPASEWTPVVAPPLPEDAVIERPEEPLHDLQVSIIGGSAEMLKAKGIEPPEFEATNKEEARKYLAEVERRLNEAD
ncbi:alkaline phosphatase family protein [uncultured Erythrobacter sp.]|uniref:alkaline phosphatase family protein n=1 Tax=uncultured Erythrobacter sp. TaxID=263913 RepID=UPI00261B74E0|nr:alkaline phosphatase family protein [uncultured Erythrobacter sp.]